MNRKKGVSPVVATVLLITMAIVLIAIIYIWAKAAIGESSTKLGEGISNACDKVSLEVSLNRQTGRMNIVNNAQSISVHGVSLRDKNGNLFNCLQLNIPPGGVESNLLVSSCEGANQETVETLIPILLDDTLAQYNCEKNEIKLD